MLNTSFPLRNPSGGIFNHDISNVNPSLEENVNESEQNILYLIKAVNSKDSTNNDCKKYFSKILELLDKVFDQLPLPSGEISRKIINCCSKKKITSDLVSFLEKTAKIYEKHEYYLTSAHLLNKAAYLSSFCDVSKSNAFQLYFQAAEIYFTNRQCEKGFSTLTAAIKKYEIDIDYDQIDRLISNFDSFASGLFTKTVLYKDFWSDSIFHFIQIYLPGCQYDLKHRLYKYLETRSLKDSREFICSLRELRHVDDRNSLGVIDHLNLFAKNEVEEVTNHWLKIRSFFFPEELSRWYHLKALLLLHETPKNIRHINVDLITANWEDLKALYSTEEILNLIENKEIWEHLEFQIYPVNIREFPEPKRVLLQFRAIKLLTGKFPEEIEDASSEAIDDGGVTKHFLTMLFKLLFGENKLVLGGDKEKEGVIPKCIIFHNEEKQKRQMKCYQSIGMFFGFSLRKGIPLGHYLHPIVFKLLHSLRQDHLKEMVNLNFSQNIFPPQSSKTYKWLMMLYLSNGPYRSAFDPKVKIIQIVQFLKSGIISPFMKAEGIQSKDQFLQLYEIDDILRAIWYIASGIVMFDEFDDWHKVKGSSPEELANQIQGTIDYNMIVSAIHFSGNSIQTRNWLLKWLKESSEEHLRQFVFAVTGSFTLLHETKIKVKIYPETKKLPFFSTCYNELYIPGNYPDYSVFSEKLNIAVEHGQSGFSNV